MAAEVLAFAPARAALVVDGRAALVVADEDAAEVAAAIGEQLGPLPAGTVARRIELAALAGALDGRDRRGPIDLAAGMSAAYDEALRLIDEELARVAAARRRRAS